MRNISAKYITEAIAGLCLEANLFLRKDVLSLLKAAYRREKNKKAKDALRAIIENAAIAEAKKIALCQDTGMPIVFAELGQGARITGGDFKEAINRGINLGYSRGYLRASIVDDPLKRGRSRYSPAVIHTDIVKGDKLKIAVLPKGFGCENRTRLKMFKPTDGVQDIENFVVEAVSSAGPDACPPYIIGLGIGGTADYACLLAKKALLRRVSAVGGSASGGKGHGLRAKGMIAKLEKDILTGVNKLKIGPMGLGGKATALAVNIERYPTHIAGLPVCVNISCHALRSAAKTL